MTEGAILTIPGECWENQGGKRELKKASIREQTILPGKSK